jgi:hypothetical protein
MEHPDSWDKNLPWAEFSYNNSYQQSLKMARFEVIYGCRCHTLLNWIEPGEKVVFGPDIVDEAKAMVHRKQEASTLCVWSWESCVSNVFAYEGCEEIWYEGKLAPCYIEPFPILEKCGTVAYKLELLPSLPGVYNIFHVSQLKKCLKALVNVVLPEVTPLEADLIYPEHPIKILDQKDHVTRRKTLKFFKIQWSNQSEEEATWESEDFLCSHHPEFELP